jgi:hypothetical protein
MMGRRLSHGINPPQSQANRGPDAILKKADKTPSIAAGMVPAVAHDYARCYRVIPQSAGLGKGFGK